MDVVVTIVVVAIIVAALATYVYLSSRGKPEVVRPLPTPKVPGLKLKPLAEATAVPSSPRPSVEPIIAPPPIPASAPLFDIDLEPVVAPPAPPVEIRWSNQFDPRSGTLDETARLRLIGDLGVVAKEWCVPLLSQAYDQERRPGHRQAALIALTACHSRAAAETFRTALRASDAAERAIAADGLADLEPAPQAKPRRTVERH